MELSDRLKELRSEKKATQADLASFLGVERTTYLKWESGDTIPDVNKLLLLSRYHNVTTDYLLGKTNIKRPPHEIASALLDDPELFNFWNTLQEREDLQILFKQTKNISPKGIKQIMRVIKAIEDEEDSEE